MRKIPVAVAHYLLNTSYNKMIKMIPTALVFLLCPSSIAFASANKKCFANGDELKLAIIQYINGGCAAATNSCEVSETYGWPINSWCVGNVTDMSELFSRNEYFNEDISDWDTSSVTDMFEMFSGASIFNGDVSKWDTSSVTSMGSMFAFAKSFNSDLNKWDTSNVESMEDMFYGAASFNIDLSNWDTSRVKDMRSMFHYATSFNQNLCAWRDNFPYDGAGRIFEDSGCKFQDNPHEEVIRPLDHFVVELSKFCGSVCPQQYNENDHSSSNSESMIETTEEVNDPNTNSSLTVGATSGSL